MLHFIVLAAEAIPPATPVLGVPWAVWAALGGAVVAGLTWFGRLLVKALNDAREDAKVSRAELVAIINRSNEVHTAHTVAIEKLTAYIERAKD